RRQRCAARAVDDLLEIEMQRMRLMQSHFEHARDDLHGAPEAARRCENERNILRRQTAIAYYLVDDFRRRLALHLQNEHCAVITVSVSELIEQRLPPPHRAARGRAATPGNAP